jgi:hypothetical protein
MERLICINTYQSSQALPYESNWMTYQLTTSQLDRYLIVLPCNSDRVLLLKTFCFPHPPCKPSFCIILLQSSQAAQFDAQA